MIAEMIRQDDIYSQEAEASVLGSLLLSDSAKVGEVIASLDAEDFWLPENQKFYTALRDVYLSTLGLDVVVLRERLKRGEDFNDVGGADAYLDEVSGSVCHEVNLDYYLAIVRSKASNRRMIQAVESMNDVATGCDEPDEKIATVQRLALELTPLVKSQQVYSVAEEAEGVLEEVFSDRTGIETGFTVLDWYLGGLRPGNFIVIGSRPSHGKTAFGVDVALNLARDGKSVLIYSLEMTKQELIERMIASIARVDLHLVKQKCYTEQQAREMADAVGLLQEHKPVLGNLRESGSIEQDADVVILLHRPDKYHESDCDYTPTNTGVFQIGKSRNGPCGEFELSFIKKYASFSNISKATET
ncbi:MAG: hypothetical protein ISS70_03110 [Phycisphaerae bacterium]|nr:hypothetical protein [Phycisphaerae bacterium]